MAFGLSAGAVTALGMGAGALFGGSKQSGTTTTDRSPWAPAQPYLTGVQPGTQRRLRAGVTPTYAASPFGGLVDESNSYGQGPQTNPESDYETISSGGTPGVLPEAATLYGNGGFTPGQQARVDQYQTTLNGQDAGFGALDTAASGLLANGVPRIADATAQGYTAAQQAGSPNLTANTYNPQTASASNAGIAQAGNVPQLGAMSRDANVNSLLNNDYNNPYLDSQIHSANGRMTNDFNAALGNIRSNAQASGGYGGSRQGIAEGIAARGLAQAMGDNASNMYSNAYNQGFGARSNLTGQLLNVDNSRQTTDAGFGQQTNLANAGFQNSGNQFNAGLNTQTSQFNAGQGNNAGQFNAGANNNMGQFNASQNNQINGNNTGALNNASQFGANANNNNGQFNANLGLSNNAQGINAMTSAGNLLNMGANGSNSVFNNSMNASNMGNNQNWSNLNNYANVVNSAAGQGGTQSQPFYTNPMGNALGMATAGMQMGNMYSRMSNNNANFGLGTNPGSQQTSMLNDQWSY